MGVELRPVNPADDAAIDAYHSICAAVRAHDLPDLPPVHRADVAAGVRHPLPSRLYQYFVVHDRGVPVGAVQYSRPMAENLHLAMLELSVHPGHRRRGIGREAFAAVAELAREHGRSLLMGEYCVPLPSGPARSEAPAAFAAAVGAQPALPEVRRRLDLTTVDSDDWRVRYDEALRLSKGYSTVWWSGPTPEEFVADVAYLDGRLVQDAPMGELHYEPEKVDAERIRATDEVFRRKRQSLYHCGARDDQTGRLVAWSVLFFSVGESSQAWQGITIVHPDHRGHRLGLLVKLENLIRTREVETRLRYVDTWNAAENAHMIAINELIGFRPVDGWVSWQCDVA